MPIISQFYGIIISMYFNDNNNLCIGKFSKNNVFIETISVNHAIDYLVKGYCNQSYKFRRIIQPDINDFKMNRQNEIEDMVTICTSTFYNYVEEDKIEGFSKEELPMKNKRKRKNERKIGKTEPKGTSIEERPFKPEDRSEFGHWEGDTIVGGRSAPNTGAVLTLVERKTRYQLTIKMKNRKADTVYKAKKKKKKNYPELNNYNIKDIFKSITFAIHNES